MRMNQNERRFDLHGLGAALKRAREEKGWTQAYVAELVYLSHVVPNWKFLHRANGSTRICRSYQKSRWNSLCCDPIMTFGTEEQKQKFLVPLAKGEKLGAFGLTEPGAGTDAQGQQTKAVLDGDDNKTPALQKHFLHDNCFDVYLQQDLPLIHS